LNTLSANNRPNLIRQAQLQDFDLIVIGGGITGAGIALDASLRGIKTLLVEKKDFAFGTSSRSTKLIHGGLRYLKNMELGLVHELGIERAIVHRIAPHLTVPEKMLTPIVKNGTYGKFLTAIGIGMYDFLAGVKKEERRKMLDKEATKAAEPLIREDILLGSALYFEYRTDDARLTMEVIKTAVQKDAVCLNYMELSEFIYENGKIIGIVCKDNLNGRPLKFKGKIVVNAAGPWVDQVRGKDEVVKGKRLHLTKGIHLVVPHAKLPVKQAVYFDIFDGRMMFVIPRGKITYFGTTDTDYKSDIEHPMISKEDVPYLLKAVNHMFPIVDLKTEDIISGWAGLRPLVHEDGKSASEISRKDEIFISPHGLISIAGGKLTGYRKMAERIMDLVMKELHKPLSKTVTNQTHLSGGDFKDYEEVKSKIEKLEKELKHHFTDSKEKAHRLIHLYGSQISMLLDYFYINVLQMPTEKALLKAEIQYCIENESVMKLDDFFIRRSGILYFNPEMLNTNLDEAGTWMKEILSKTDEEIDAEKEELRKYLSEVNHFNDK
jgi:glycerol-3-phosphate dehydrogenase